MSDLQLRDLTSTIGVEIRGLDTSTELDGATCDRLRELFATRSVLVFPDLEIDEDYQRYLCYMLIGKSADGRSLDDADGQGMDEPPRQAPLQIVSNREEQASAPYGRLMFHCDTMWSETTQPVISLYGLEVDEPGVPTLFVSMGDAWDSLSPELRARVQRLEARHGHEHSYSNRGGDDDVIDARFDKSIWTTTPVANPHPVSGRVGLYVSEQVTIEILDVSAEENESLLEELYAHLYRPAEILEVDWYENQLVIWDNQAVQHARKTVELDGPVRTLRKVTGPLTFSLESVGIPVFSKVDNQ